MLFIFSVSGSGWASGCSSRRRRMRTRGGGLGRPCPRRHTPPPPPPSPSPCPPHRGFYPPHPRWEASRASGEDNGIITRKKWMVDGDTITKKCEMLLCCRLFSGPSSKPETLMDKTKKFLAALVKFGASVSPSVGTNVRKLVFRLAVGWIPLINGIWWEYCYILNYFQSYLKCCKSILR